MADIESFREKAKEYGCSALEIDYIDNIISNTGGNKFLFTFPQFKAFCEYWRQYNGICPGSWGFTIYPKNNGIELGSKHFAGVSMTLMYLTSDLYRASFGPGFIENVDKCWNRFKDTTNKLILLVDDRNDSGFYTLGYNRSKSFIGGGRCYCERVAQPMGSLEESHRIFDGTLDAKERIYWSDTRFNI